VSASALRAALEPIWPGLVVERVAETASTNSDLLARLRRGDATPRLLVADRQTAGRGRHGRAWRAQGGASLTASFALPLARTDWSGLSLAVGVALADALDPAEPPRIGLKWPNDLWLLDAPGAGRKLAGVLIESVATERPRVAVIGIGVNVASMRDATMASAAVDAPPPIATLHELDAVVTPWSALVRVAPALLRALRRFEVDGFAAFHPAYARRDLLAGHAVRSTHAALPLGVAEGVTHEGALVLRAPDGARVEVTSGEVSVRPAPTAVLP
jgi:BirA family biotin operon repressor/biotin-[acetyl-CoA-carboxylase] ligase